MRQLGTFDSFVLGIFILGVFAIGLYPSANLLLSIAFAMIPAIIIALTYVFLSVAMPRSGSDYVWVSRILNQGAWFHGKFRSYFHSFHIYSARCRLIDRMGNPGFYDIAITTGCASAGSIATFLSPIPGTFSTGGGLRLA